MADCLTLAKSHRGEADLSLLSLHESVAHFGSVLKSKKKRININYIKLKKTVLTTTLLGKKKLKCLTLINIESVSTYHDKWLITSRSMLHRPVHSPILKNINGHFWIHNTFIKSHSGKWCQIVTKFIELSIDINKGDEVEVDFVSCWLWRSKKISTVKVIMSHSLG